MPAREQIERSRRRNRERGYTAEYFREAAGPADRARLQREATAGPRWRHPDLGGPQIDAWGGPEPPAA